MTQYTVYVCDICGYESKEYEEILNHEASHFNLSASEFESYNTMKGFAKYYLDYIRNDQHITSTNRSKSRNMYIETVKKIKKFEEEHSLIHTEWEEI